MWNSQRKQNSRQETISDYHKQVAVVCASVIPRTEQNVILSKNRRKELDILSDKARMEENEVSDITRQAVFEETRLYNKQHQL
jgi:hypothetical protein